MLLPFEYFVDDLVDLTVVSLNEDVLLSPLLNSDAWRPPDSLGQRVYQINLSIVICR